MLCGIISNKPYQKYHAFLSFFPLEKRKRGRPKKKKTPKQQCEEQQQKERAGLKPWSGAKTAVMDTNS